MASVGDYFERTRSASEKLFEALRDYRSVLQEIERPVLVQDGTSSKEKREAELERWLEDNERTFSRVREAEQKYIDERFAIGVICGSVLQIAAMAFQAYSLNEEIAQGFEDVIKPGSKAAKFCVGRKIRGVPLGLVVYAGRNQYNHMDDEQLREPNAYIFDRLATGWTIDNETEYRDPALDLSNRDIENFSSNILHLLGWGSYEGLRGDVIRAIEG